MRASGVSLRGVCLLLPTLSSAAPAAAPVPILVRDVPLRGELVEGGTHAYRVDLREGEALRAVVEQRGIDVVVALRGPRGGIEVEMDGVSGGRGTEELAWEAAQAGVYLVEVQPRAANAPPGGYSLTVHVSARADEAQRAWISAERLFMEGRRTQASGANLERAAEAYEGALADWRRAGDRTWEGMTLQALGVACLGLGRYDCARSRSEQALALHRSVGNRVGQGATLNNLGNVHRESGQYDRAQESYQQALAISREAEDRRVEAATLNNLASVYNELSQYERAQERYEEALVIWREIGSRAGEAATLNNLGNVYQDLGRYERARSYYEQTLAMSRQDGNRRAAGTTLNNLGNVTRLLREYGQARAYYEEALRISREVGDRTGEANVLNNLGELSDNEEQSHRSTMVAPRGEENARDFYAQALAIRREMQDRGGEEVALANLGSACRRLGDEGPAREHLTAALALAREIKAPRAEAADLFELALLARHAGDLDLARAQVAAALGIVETIRSEVAGHDLRSSFLASTLDYYALSIDVLMQLHRRDGQAGHDAAALETSERAHARSLLDLLAEAGAEIRAGAPAALLSRERELLQVLNARAAARQHLLADEHTPEEAAAMEQELARLTGEYEDVQARLRRASPRSAALLQPRPLTVAEIQDELLDRDTLLLVYWLGARGDERSYLWAVTPGSLTSYELPPREAVEAAARRVSVLLSASAPGRDGPSRTPAVLDAGSEYGRAAAALSEMLLSPVADRLAGKRVVVVPDGALQYVPFAALPLPSAPGAGHEPVPLIVEHEVVSLPSASSLAALRRDMAGRVPAAKAVAVLADPVFSADDERVKARVRGGTGARLPRLPFARREAEAIAAAAGPGAVTMTALGFEASRQTAISPGLAQYRIVHFATHGVLDAARPELSGVVFSLVDEQGAPQDGFLRLHDVYNLHLPAELVVLSACRTALGQDVKGEGLIGLTRGFMYAGAARVVASLWQVDDASTSELMGRFYWKMLRDGERPAAALRDAQVAMWREGVWRSPRDWAGFVLQGEWR